MFRSLARIIRSLLSRARLERDLDAELQFHLERESEENLRRGMPSGAARRAARLTLGHIDTIRGDCRQAWGVRQIDVFIQDVRYGLRSLRRNPGFAFAAICTLALGIGATTAIFSVIDSFLLHGVPFSDPDRLVEIYRWGPGGGGPRQPAAVLALLLAGAGVYAVVAYETSQRTQELGIRMALGATRRDVLRHVMGRCILLSLAGVAVGLGGAVVLTRLLSSLLFDVQPTDPTTFAAAAVFLLAASAAAGYLPACRATKIDPMVALRTE